VHRRCIGPSNPNIFRDFFGADITKEQIDAYSKEKEMVYREIARSDPKNLNLMEGAPELFDLLKEKGIPVIVATASPIDNVLFYLNDLGLNRWITIDEIVYEEGKLASKPDPAFYLEAARRLGVKPEECIIAEDSPTGIQAAISAKAGKIIAIDRGGHRAFLESKPEIHAIVHDFRDFERFL
jgi:HAD superfamily hydrolase (TIGR01509 family)